MKIEDLGRAYDILREYKGENSYMIDLRNKVMVYKMKINDFEAEFVLMNKDTEPKFINKIVKVADWYGLKLQEQFGTEFVPQVLQIGWYMGQNSTHYFFYCRYRRSIEKAVFLIAPKGGILTDFLIEDFRALRWISLPTRRGAAGRCTSIRRRLSSSLLRGRRAYCRLEWAWGRLCQPFWLRWWASMSMC